MVVIAERAIASPVVTRPDALVAMNKASLNKFGPRVKPGGLIIMNAPRIEQPPNVDSSVTILAVPADELADELGNPRAANMAAIGAYLEKRGILSPDSATACLADVLAGRLHKTIPVNAQALRRGGQFVRDGC
jgi:2-oxoglutarate ferredoxin oxidoreductase subunit gamma